MSPRSASAVVDFDKKGYLPYNLATTYSANRYLTKTTVETFSWSRYDELFDLNASYSGSLTTVYTIDPRSGKQTAVRNGSASSSYERYNGDEKITVTGSATTVNNVTTVSDDWSGHNRAREAGHGEPDSTTETTWSESFDGPDLTLGGDLSESFNASLTDQNTDEAVDEIRFELLDAIPLESLDPLSPISMTARFGKAGSEAAALTAATAAHTAAVTNLATANGLVATKQSALATAIATSDERKSEVESLRTSLYTALAAWEAASVCLRRWTRLQDEDQIPGAEAAVASTLVDLESARAAEGTARTQWEGATSAVVTARRSLRNSVFQAAVAAARVANLLVVKDLAQANKDAADANEEGIDTRVFVVSSTGSISAVSYSQRDGNIVTRIKYTLATGLDWAVLPPSVRMDWRTAAVDIDEEGIADPEVTFADFDFQTELADSDSYIQTQARILDPPENEGRLYLVGLEVKARLAASIERLGGAWRKRGFPQYLPAAVPRIYARETASGGFPGCPLDGRIAKAYSGFQEFAPPEELPDAEPQLVVGFSDDVSMERRSIVPGFADDTGELNPVEREFLDAGEILSPTSRRWRKESLCGKKPIVDQMSLGLSNEVTTADLKDRVDQVADQGWNLPQDEDPLPPVEQLGECAIEYLSADERYYAKQKMRLYLTIFPPDEFGQIWPPEEGGPSLTARWVKKTLNFATGVITSAEQTLSLASPAFSLDVPIEIPPQSGKQITLGQFEAPADPRFWDKIRLFSAE